MASSSASAPLGLCGVLTQDQLRARVGEPHDLVDVQREAVLEAQRVAPRLDAERGRNLDERRERRRRHDDIGAGLAADEKQRQQRLGAAVEDEDLLGIGAVHRRERGAQRLAALASGNRSTRRRRTRRARRSVISARSSATVHFGPVLIPRWCGAESRYFASHSSSTKGTSFMGLPLGVRAVDSGIIWPSAY